MANRTNASTGEWLDQVHAVQEKDEKNRRTQGDGHPDKVLPNKQHKN